MEIVVKTTIEVHDGVETIMTKYDSGKTCFSMRGGPPCEPHPQQRLKKFHINYSKANEIDLEAAVDIAIADAKKNLPPGVVFEIRTMPRPRYGAQYDFGARIATIKEQIEDWGIAWIEISDAGPERFRKTFVETQIDQQSGYLVVARMEA